MQTRYQCMLTVTLGTLVCVLPCSARAGTTVQCLENALPIETLGDDAEQRDTLRMGTNSLLPILMVGISPRLAAS